MPEYFVGALSYFVVPAIVFLLVDPYRRNFFVRFHSLQCLFTTAAIFVCTIALLVASTIVRLIPFIGIFLVLLVWPLFGLAGLLLWLLLVYKAYQHQVFRLPLVGDIAERQAVPS